MLCLSLGVDSFLTCIKVCNDALRNLRWNANLRDGVTEHVRKLCFR